MQKHSHAILGMSAAAVAAAVGFCLWQKTAKCVPSSRDKISVCAKGSEPVQDPRDDENNALIAQLDQDHVIEMCRGGGRKCYIGSVTDDSKTSFGNKTIFVQGDGIDTSSRGLGYTCRKGLKPEVVNQDSWTVLKVEGDDAEAFSMYGVFDGHGQKGHDVSDFVKDKLPKLILKDNRFKTANMPVMLADCFKTMQSLVASADRGKRLSAQMSGTTCSIVIHDHMHNKLTIAHVADCTVVLGRYKDKAHTEVEAVTLTRDHKPDLPDEKKRIERDGGRVVFDGYANHRVYAKNGRYPGLNMSRSLGDLMGHADAGVCAVPEVSERLIESEDQFVLICSDGVWEFITSDDAVRIISEFPPTKAMQAAERLAKEAWDRWIKEEGGAVVDNISVILMHLQL